MPDKKLIKGRFAPTPSGQMHLGNVFAALLGWLWVRAQGGSMLLRVEDLDLTRTSPAFTESIANDLLWLGLSWEEGPSMGGSSGLWLQSQRTAFYEEKLEILAQQNLVYPCFCSRAELHAAHAPHLTDGTTPYTGRCKSLTGAQIAQKSRTRGAALRVVVPNESICIHDALQGPLCQNLARECGDFILRRSDGVFAYQLAAPADDGEMGVTHVARGRDLLESAPRQTWLMRTLGYAPPCYFHLPLLLAQDGRRLSKRDGDMDLSHIRLQMKGPEPLLGALAHIAGLLDRAEPITAQELIPLFIPDKIPKNDICLPARFFWV